MNINQPFWKNLNKPFYALAPMAGITDFAFRQMCIDLGADVVYSEMASINALVYQSTKTLEMLRPNNSETPYVVQLFGDNPNHFAIAAKIITEQVRPTGLDINLGCPAPKILKQKAGAELFQDLPLARKVIKAVSDSTDLPVSIKTRRKAGQMEVLKFLDGISDLKISALMIHGRELKQQHSGPVDADIIKQARNYFGGIIIANGGVKNFESAQALLNESQAEGIAIGQAAMGRPWIFDDIKKQKEVIKDFEEIKNIILQHAELMYADKGPAGILEMRKHLCWYVTGQKKAAELRMKLVKVESIDDIKKALN